MSDEKKNELMVFGDFLVQRKAALANVLPAHMDEGRFCRMVINACLRNPDLLTADRGSLFLAVMTLGEMGLEPSIGQAALVPFKTKLKIGGKEVWKTLVQAIPMYQGLLQLAFNSGHLSKITAVAVFAGDAFDYELGLHPQLTHKPAGQSDEVTHAYMTAHFKDGGEFFCVMTRREIDRIRASSKGKDAMMWRDHYAEAAKKTVLRRGLKMVPRSFELSAALAAENRADAGGSALPLGAQIPDDLLASIADPDEEPAVPKAEPWKPDDALAAGKAEAEKALAEGKLGTAAKPKLELDGGKA